MKTEIPKVHKDDRGLLVELIKQKRIGQFYYSTTKPGKVRGNHYHTHKWEIFFVIKGKGMMVIEHIKTKKRKTHILTGKKIIGIKPKPYYAHAVKNIGKDDMLLLIYCNEVFNKRNPDTYRYVVI